MKSRIFHLALIFSIGLFLFNNVNCQDLIRKDHDYLMPAKGKSMLELYSGLPYVAIGQYSYGVSDRFSVGVLYGYTPFVLGYGVRIKSVIAQPSQTMRITLKSPFIYYPKMKSRGDDPWVLAWPSINVEWRLQNGARVWTGAGIIGAACVEYLFDPHGGHEASGLVDRSGMKKEMEKKESMANIWNTFQFGYSKPVSDKLSYLIEIAPVMEGLKIKSPHGFLDKAPVILTFGLSYTL